MQNWITTKIELDTDKEVLNKFLYKTFSVDSNGRVIDETEFDSESNPVCKRIYRYFETDEIKEYIEYDPSDELLERHIYSKNDFGEIDKIEQEFLGGRKTIKEYSFSDLGNADRAVIRNENGDIVGYEIYIYDDKDQLTTEIFLDANQNESSKSEITYLEEGLPDFELRFVEGQLLEKEAFEYDERSNMKKKILSNYHDNFEVVDDYQYDINNNMVYNSTHQNGELIFENKCKYDESNNLIFEECFELNYWEKVIVRHERLIHEYEG